MAMKVIEEMRNCNECKKTTLHRKNSKQISWIMHIFLSIVTLGIWLFIWVIILFWHTISKPVTAIANNWVCAECGS